VIQYLEGLSRATPPYIERHGETPQPGRKCRELWQWHLVRDVGVDAPRVTRDGKPVTQGAGNEAMWTAMKTLREFDCRELVAAASAGDVKVSTTRTRRMYCLWLTHAGYLVVACQGAATPRRATASTSRRTPGRARRSSRNREVIDGNTGTVAYEGRGKGAGSKT
jgi:hypothetical protein